MQLRGFCGDIARSVAFLSRIPVPDRFFDGHDGSLSRAVRAFPVAGLVVALPAAILFSALPAPGGVALLPALIALALHTLITGALHEDGLGDAADGLGGGRDRDHALTIMKDSRTGSYGAVALILSFGLRAAALAALATVLTPLAAGVAFAAAAVISRAAMVWHWSALPPARLNGVAASAGEPEATATAIALASGGAVAAVLLVPAFSFTAPAVAIAAAGTATFLFTAKVRNRIGGHTGDTIGAAQQIAEISTLCALALAA